MTILPISFRTKPILGASVILLGAALIAVITWQGVSALPQDGEVKRELSVLEAGWPSKILTIEEITGVNAKNFPEGFSIKVKNISDRHIYYLNISVELPNSGPYLNNRPGLFRLYWGDPKLTKPNELASTNHESIAPGKSRVLALSQDHINHFFGQATNRSEFLSQGTSKLVVVFQTLSFGDGIYFVRDAFVRNAKGAKDTSPLIRSDGGCNSGILYNDNHWCRGNEESGTPYQHSSYNCFDCDGGEWGQYIVSPQACGCDTV